MSTSHLAHNSARLYSKGAVLDLRLELPCLIEWRLVLSPLCVNHLAIRGKSSALTSKRQKNLREGERVRAVPFDNRPRISLCCCCCCCRRRLNGGFTSSLFLLNRPMHPLFHYLSSLSFAIVLILFFPAASVRRRIYALRKERWRTSENTTMTIEEYVD